MAEGWSRAAQEKWRGEGWVSGAVLGVVDWARAARGRRDARRIAEMERRMFMRVRMYQRMTDSRSLLDDVRNVGRRRRDEKRGGGVCGQVPEKGCKAGWV
jgi:hypothetical protein